MPPAPPSRPPPLNASRAFLQALNALSPSSLFRVRQQHAQSRSPTAAHSTHSGPLSTKPAIPVHAMDALLQLVDFLEEHHRRVDGLYKRDPPSSSAHETHEILRVLRGAGDDPLPDLARFNPHAITAAIKEVLGDDYGPLIPYTASQSLLDRTIGRDDSKTLDEVIVTFKQLTPPTRELLKVLLIHLHHISTSTPSRMNVKSLAKHVGVLVIRPTDEPNTSATKDLFKQRQRIARVMIENANALPYNEESELQLSNRTDAESPSGTRLPVSMTEQSENVDERSEQERVHYVQVIWDANVYKHTEDTLRSLLSPFGPIATLTINASGNRAIAAFTMAEDAQAVAEAALAGVRIRRRKLRTPKRIPASILTRSMDSEFETPRPSPTKDADSVQLKLVDERQPAAFASAAKIQPTERIGDAEVTELHEVTSIDSARSVGDTVLESPTFLHKLERPPSMLLLQRAMKTLQRGDQMTLEDVESLPSSPEATHHYKDDKPTRRPLSEIDEITEEEERSAIEPLRNGTVEEVPVESEHSLVLQRRRSLKQLLTVKTSPSDVGAKRDEGEEVEKSKQRKPFFSPQARTKIGLIGDLKLMMARKRTPRSLNATKNADDVDHPASDLTTPLPEEATKEIARAAETRSIKTQTKKIIHPVQDQATTTDDLLIPDASASKQLESAEGHIVKISTCLSGVKAELTQLASAISACRHSDVDRAILRAHERLNELIARTLDSDNDQQRRPTQVVSHSDSATSEFVSFLETRASTQVKILEAEVRAGQELLRLHRSQHQKETSELEAEITCLRVIQSETEKMCAELRSDLRKCRAELTCHIATAASIQSERRDADEKLVICENKLRAKEQELLQLQLAHDEMRDTAGNAQRRLEEERGNQVPSRSKDPTTSEKINRADLRLTNTVAFLKKHSKGTQQDVPKPRSNAMLTTVLRPGQYVNTDELASMKKRLQESIHSQIEVTKKSLRELQAFGNDEPLQEDDDTDLEQLEQQLACAQADMNATMMTSRQKLQHLLDPVRPFSGEVVDDDTASAGFDHFGLVEGLLANALSTDPMKTNQERPVSAASTLDGASQCYPVDPTVASWRHRTDETQSEMYKKWMRGRAPDPPPSKVTATAQAPTSAFKGSPRAKAKTIHQAQESMLRFQQTLASMKKSTQ